MSSSTFVFDAKTTAFIDQLKIETKSPNRTEVIRKALFLLNLVVAANQSGSQLNIVSADGSSQLIQVY